VRFEQGRDRLTPQQMPLENWNTAYHFCSPDQYVTPARVSRSNGEKGCWLRRRQPLTQTINRGIQPTMKQHHQYTNPTPGEIASKPAFPGRGPVRHLSLILGAFALALAGAQEVRAVTRIPISTGQLPTGEIISITQLIFGPDGDSTPWHFHTGTGWLTVVSGTVTEDQGCGTALIEHPAGSAFSEIPGHVHQVANLGNGPAVVIFVLIYPACDPPTIVVTGPDCEGDSGRSHLEPIPECP
jgi:quercetin dioxygenase-like cupin family protein